MPSGEERGLISRTVAGNRAYALVEVIQRQQEPTNGLLTTLKGLRMAESRSSKLKTLLYRDCMETP